MRRHPTDLVGLIFGTAFAIAGVAFLVNAVTDNGVNPAWATGLGLMLLGAIALVATVARNIRHDDGEPLAIVDAPPMPEGPLSEAVTSDD